MLIVFLSNTHSLASILTISFSNQRMTDSFFDQLFQRFVVSSYKIVHYICHPLKMSSTTLRFQLLALFIASLIVASCLADLCPDHKKSCRKGQTCCDDKQGGYGCCPYDNATCCTDGLHCCPQDTVCDLSGGRCRRNKSLKQVLLIPATKSDRSSEVVGENGLGDILFATNEKQQCPDLKQSCPLTYTCCQAPEEGYSCCPYTNATCCADKIHCCPQGSKCGSGRCE